MCYVETCLLLALLYVAKGDYEHLPKDCGRTRFDNNNVRIIGGNNAALGQFPWMALIGGYDGESKKPKFICGGSLIHSSYVLTAAHCISDTDVVRLGDTILENDIDCDRYGVCAPPEQDIAIKQIMIFPEYGDMDLDNDIALIELKEPAELNEFVQPACLPESLLLHEDFYGEDTMIMGWGYVNSHPRKTTPYLQYISAPILHPNACNEEYNVNLLPTQWCIGYPEGRDSCNGDSGGPVTKSMIVDDERRWYLLGIVSFGQTICGYGPAVYTDVSKYLDWIIENIKID